MIEYKATNVVTIFWYLTIIEYEKYKKELVHFIN